MAQVHDETESKTVVGDDVGEVVNGGTKNGHRKPDYVEKEEDEDLKSLYSLICLTIGSILFPDSKTGDASSSFLERMKNSVAENGPKLREASARTGHEILLWTRKGSSLRALLVITVSGF